MTTNGNGNVPSKIVELLITNLTELTKQVQSMPTNLAEGVSHDIERLTYAITKVVDKINTPPRHEEINDGITELNGNIKALNELVKIKIIDKLHDTIRGIRIASIVFGLAVLISSVIVTAMNYNIENKVLKAFKKVESEKPAITEEHKRGVSQQLDELKKMFEEHIKQTGKGGDEDGN